MEKSVWEEIRNLKKCVIMMFAKQEKDVVFLETVVGLFLVIGLHHIFNIASF